MHQVLRQILTRVQTAILQRPRRVLLSSLLLVLVALVLAGGVELRTSRTELVPADDPDQQRWASLIEDFGGTEMVVACVEASPDETKTPEQLREFVDRLAEEFRREPLVDGVFHRFDVDWMALRAFHLVPADTLREVGRAVRAERPFLRGLTASENLAKWNEALAARIESGLATESSPVRDGGPGLGWLVKLLHVQRRFLEDPESLVAALRNEPPFLDSFSDDGRGPADGYLETHDGRTYFLLVSPAPADDGLESMRRLVRTLRDRGDTVSRLLPGFRLAFTGQPAMVVEEMDTVRTDTWLTSLVAIAGVAALTFLVFRWRSHALLVLASLGMGVAWALGAVRLELGYLNLITSSFISTLIGIGVAYGVHPVSEYELEGAHTGDPIETVRESFHRTGTGVVVAAVTTAAAFFSIQLMRFRGFSELGLVAGVGVLLCLASAMISLPALLVLYSRWRRKRDRSKPMRSAPIMDWFWVSRVSPRVCRYPRTVTVLALALTLLSAWAALGIGFDANILDLMPRNAESLRYQRRMALDSDLSPLHNIVVADDLDALLEMEGRAGTEPTIARFDSVARFLPDDPRASSAALAELARLTDSLRLEAAPTLLRPGPLEAALTRLEAALAEAAEAAFVADLADSAGSLEEARLEVERSLGVVSVASPSRVQEWNLGQEAVFRWARTVLTWTRRALRTEPPTLETLPPEIRERFFTRSGRLLGFLIPSQNVFDTEFLEQYVAASRRVSGEVTGFPQVFHKMTGRITTGFYRAVGLGLGLVTLILILDLRHPRDALLALVPLIMGVVWMMAGMRLLGISFNFANLVAVPLIIGVGIDNGVHVIHRVRFEGRNGMGVVLAHTGRAILIASMTTMIGFGSLALASHRGLASLGGVLLLGVGSCLITSTWVLPNVLVVLGLTER